MRPLFTEYLHKRTRLVHRFDCVAIRCVPAGRLEPFVALGGDHCRAGCCHEPSPVGVQGIVDCLRCEPRGVDQHEPTRGRRA